MKAKLITLILAISMILSVFSACSGNGSVLQRTALTANDRYKVEANADPYANILCFKDVRYYYYILNLGVIKNVPLETVPSHDYYGGSKTATYTVSSITEETISNMLTVAEQNVLSGTLSFNYHYGNQQTKHNVDLGLSLTHSNTTTRTDSITNTMRYATQSTTSVTIDMSGKPNGNYRYILMGDIQSYVCVIYDTETQKYDYYTYSTILGQGYVLDYSESLSFATSGGKLTFNFDKDRLAGVEPTTMLPAGSYIPEPLTYESPYKEKKIDASDRYRYDSFDISKLQPYMNDDYTITFKIKVLMAEENAGYQEVFLVNDQGTTVGKNTSIEYGGGGDAKESKGWYDAGLTFAVSGEKCSDTMHIEYGAHGDNSDDWYRYQVAVEVSVSAK